MSHDSLYSATPQVLTHDSGAASDRCWQLCKCSKCGVVKQCTPTFDFYVLKSLDPLYCESCMRAGVGRSGRTIVVLP